MNPELEARVKQARDIAVDEFHMDPGDVRFIMAPANIIYATAAHGLPGLWSHWSEGREYWLNKGSHDAGQSRIYEMVVHTKPFLALLHDANPDILNVMVAAHVYGHTHLMGSSVYSKGVSPHILDTVAAWKKRIEGYEEEHGDLVVEAFIDKVLSLEPFADAKFTGKVFKEEIKPLPAFPDLLPAPPVEKPEKVFQPTGDLFGFLAKYAEDLEGWQRDILEIYRQRTIYFQPQYKTKIIHEGFASISHRRIMEKVSTTDAEWLEYSKINSGVMSPGGGGVNPYWLGHALLEAYEKEHGWDALLEMVAVEDDCSLIRNHLTEKLVEKLDLFSFRFHDVFDEDEDKRKKWIVDEEPKEWEIIRDALVRKFDNMRSPVIEIVDFDADGKRALHLVHRYDGRRLFIPHADKALAAIADIWGQRVLLDTTVQKGDVRATAWAPSERDGVAVTSGNPTDWQYQ